MTRVAIRVDASTIIGSGHVIRCVTLAEELRGLGADVCFVCRPLPGDYCGWLKSRGYVVHRLPARKGIVPTVLDATQTQEALSKNTPVEWLVTDHYGVDREWEDTARAAARRIMVIDDLADRSHHCDLLLNQNLPAAGDSYAALVPAGTRVLQGPRYALLRPEFARLRCAQPPRDGIVRRILVCFGGTDAGNHTAAALRALRDCAGGVDHIDVVLGPSNPHREHIAALCAETPRTLLHSPATDMADLMTRADLAIGAGGAMSWERACLGVPTVAFGIAGNQRKVLEVLIEGGYVVGVPELPSPDFAKMGAWIRSALENQPLLRGLAQRAATLVDGLGAQRVANAMLPVSLVFRPARIEDTDMIFQYRNDPAVRGASLDGREISREGHDAWMKQTLSNPQRILLIAERDGRPQGVVRFDLSPAEATISVYRAPNAGPAGLGLVRQATAWLRSQHSGIKRVVAEVLPGNAASLAAFRAAGYRDGKYVLDTDLDTP